MAGLKIRKDDNVVIVAGKDKGKQGKVLKAFPATNKVLIEGVNEVIKHQKPTASSEGGRVSKIMPIEISNVAHVDPETGKATRVRYEFRDGKKVRVACKSGKVIGE